MRARFRHLFRDLRTEGGGGVREAAAIGLGIFIGCLPLFGFHLVICWTTGWLLRLNRLKLYLAANISNPLFAPTLVFLEIQTGAWIRRGTLHHLTLETVKTTSLAVFGLDALLGSLMVGTVLGTGMAIATYALSRGSRDDDAFATLVQRSSDRFVATSVTAWEFARGKLRRDPVYRAIVCGGLLPSGGSIIDLGCGQGLSLALLADAEALARSGRWPLEWGRAPCFDRRVGIETRTRTAAIARAALNGDAEIVHADIRQVEHMPCRAVLLMDVLHMMPFDAQEQVIGAVAAALEPGGVLLVREADAAAGMRFTMVRAGNRIKALALGRWHQRFCFRSVSGWAECLSRQGLRVECQPMGNRTFANVLFSVTKVPEESSLLENLAQPRREGRPRQHLSDASAASRLDEIGLDV